MQRRDFLKTASLATASVIAISLVGNSAFAAEVSVADIIAKECGGKGAKDGGATLIAPAIAENGQVVPLKIEVDKPVEDVKALHLYAVSNPTPKIISVYLTPELGKAYFSTRTKLAKSQDVLLLVELKDGSFLKDTKNVKVTIGGCG